MSKLEHISVPLAKIEYRVRACGFGIEKVVVPEEPKKDEKGKRHE